MKDHYVTFAGYNAWANRRLYEAAALLSDAEYRADKGAFFKASDAIYAEFSREVPDGKALIDRGLALASVR